MSGIYGRTGGCGRRRRVGMASPGSETIVGDPGVKGAVDRDVDRTRHGGPEPAERPL